MQGGADCLTLSPLCSTSAPMSRWLQYSGYVESSEHLLPVGCEPSPRSCYASVSCSMREEHLSLQITVTHLLNHAEQALVLVPRDGSGAARLGQPGTVM